MRILILSWRDLSHPRAGGSEVYAQNLARHWAGAGHQVTFFCAAVSGQPADEVIDGYRVVRRGGRLGVYRAARLYAEAAAGDFDVILDVVNTRPFLSPRFTASTPSVALIHQLAADVWRYEVPLPLAIVGRRIVEPRWLRTYTDVPVLAVSPSTLQDLVALGLRRVSLVPEGVDPLPPGARTPKASVPTVVWVGRLSANKRPDDALRAFALMRGSVPAAALHVVGDGPLRTRLEAASEPGVTFHGRVSQDVKHRIVSSAHALIATSVREGWGLTISEAALLGTPAVGYDVPGLRDSIPAAGGRLTHPSPEALAATLVSQLQGWEHQAHLDAGDAGVKTWSEVAGAVIAHLEAATDRPGPTRRPL